MAILTKVILFYLGGCSYVGLELLWRGYSDGSMFIAGGLCLVLIGHLNAVQPRLPLPLRALVGAGIVTTVELGIGLLVNREYAVWDYRGRMGNLWGQICPAFCLLWLFLAAVVLLIHDPLEEKIRRRLQPSASIFNS